MSTLELSDEDLIERTKRAVRDLFDYFEPIDPLQVDENTKGYADTGVVACDELLILRQAREGVIARSAGRSLKEHDRNVVFSEQAVVVPLEKHLMNLCAGPKWSKYYLDIQRVGDGTVHIVACAQRGR